MKFEKDFDFESANAQFNKEEIDREFQSKLKIKGNFNRVSRNQYVHIRLMGCDQIHPFSSPVALHPQMKRLRRQRKR